MADAQRCPLAESGTPVPTLDTLRCNGCGLCVLACPCGAISMQDAKPFFACVTCCSHNDHCPVIQIGIHPCEVACPEQAISVVFTIGQVAGTRGD